MFKLTYLLRRRPDLSEAAFDALWRTDCQQAFEAAARDLSAESVQIGRRLQTVCEACFGGARNLEAASYDAVVELIWPSLECYQQAAGAAAGIAAMDRLVQAERRFVDFPRSQALFSSPLEVDNRASP